MNDTAPDLTRSALLTVDVQCDFALPGAPAEIAGTLEAVPAMRRVVEAYRGARRPIVQVVRLYLPDGSNVDLCRRSLIRGGVDLVRPDGDGSQLVEPLRPASDFRLDSARLLAGELQPAGPQEWILYKPRWGAFYQTPLHDHLRRLSVHTLVVCGCNFPNCPRTTLYEASERDYRLVLIRDGTSGLYRQGEHEMAAIGVRLWSADQVAGAL